jgi:integrase
MLATLIRERDMAALGIELPEEKATITLADLRDRYVEELATRAGATHCEFTRRRLVRILKQIPAVNVEDLTAAMVLDWRRKRVRGGASNRTTNIDVNTLKSMLRWAHRAELIERNSLASIAPLPQTQADLRRNRRALSDAEIQQFLLASERDDAEKAARKESLRTISNATKGQRYADQSRLPRIPQTPLWRTFLETGARWGELTHATWSDVDLEQGTLTLRAETTKSKKTRRIPIRSELCELLRSLRETQGKALQRVITERDRIFVTPAGFNWEKGGRNSIKLFDTILQLAGIPKIDANGRTLDIHALRHSFASRLARAGVSITQAQKALGHSDPRLTANVYTHLGVDDLRAALECVPALPSTPAARLTATKLPIRSEPRQIAKRNKRASL